MVNVLTKGLLLLSLLISTTAMASPAKMMIFIVQPDRQRQTLENDAVSMANIIQSANSGDFIQGFTTSGNEIFSLKLDVKNSNALQVKQAKNRAIADLKGFFMKLFNPSTKEKEMGADVAGAIALAFDRFNAYAPPYQRFVLVMLSAGLQRDGAINFTGCFPSDSWLEHRLSPFSAIRPNATPAKIEAILIPQRSDYVNSYHAAKMERWYGMLFQRKQAQLIRLIYDHQSAAQFIARPGQPSLKSPIEPVDLHGDLALTRVEGLKMEEGEEQ